MLLRMERAFRVSINCYNPARSWHFELEVCIMRYRIKYGECGSSEQCVIGTVEGDDIEDQLLTSEVVRGSKDHLHVIEPVQRASTPGMTPLNVVFVGLILRDQYPFCALYPDRAGSGCCHRP